MADKNISDLEKQIMREEAMRKGPKSGLAGIMQPGLGGIVKRQKLDSFRDKKNFISGDRQGQGDRETKKVNENSLWDDHERAFLDDVTLNLIPDDEHMNTKGKTVMKWDKVKKRYMLQKVDREGRIMKERKNEAGKKISKKNLMMNDQDTIYKKWQ